MVGANKFYRVDFTFFVVRLQVCGLRNAVVLS